jgi:hypothetical protein
MASRAVGGHAVGGHSDARNPATTCRASWSRAPQTCDGADGDLLTGVHVDDGLESKPSQLNNVDYGMWRVCAGGCDDVSLTRACVGTNSFQQRRGQGVKMVLERNGKLR